MPRPTPFTYDEAPESTAPSKVLPLSLYAGEISKGFLVAHKFVGRGTLQGVQVDVSGLKPIEGEEPTLLFEVRRAGKKEAVVHTSKMIQGANKLGDFEIQARDSITLRCENVRSVHAVFLTANFIY